MKKTDRQLAQTIISAVGRAVRKWFEPTREQVIQLSEKLTQAEGVITQQRETIEKLSANVSEMSGRYAERFQQMEAVILQIKNIEPPRVPTAEEIATHVTVPQPPSVDDVVRLALRELPTTEQVKQFVADAVPKPEDVAKLVTAPIVPTAEEIAKLVVVTVPSAEEIAKLVPAPVVPTVEEIAKAVPIPTVPSEQQIAEHVRQQFELRETPTLQQVKQLVTDAIPTAEDVAKLVPMPQIPTIELPELPEIPTLDEIVGAVKEILPSLIPAPIAGKSVTLDDIRPMLEELIKALPKPQDGKSLTIDDVRPLFAQWVIEFERNAVQRHDQILAQMPRPKDGRDGKGFADLRNVKQELIGDRVLRLFVIEGDERIDLCEFKFSHPLYRDVFIEDREYERGDQVTRDGCQWIALKDQPKGIPGTSDDWQLAVKKGRDGRDGKVKDATSTQVRVAPRTGGK